MQFYGRKGQAIGWTALDLFSYAKALLTGRHNALLWDGLVGSVEGDREVACWPDRTRVTSKSFKMHSHGMCLYHT